MSFPARLWRVVRRVYERDEDNRCAVLRISKDLGFKTFVL